MSLFFKKKEGGIKTIEKGRMTYCDGNWRDDSVDNWG